MRIEHYTQLDGQKISKVFPDDISDRYFYINTEDEYLLDANVIRITAQNYVHIGNKGLHRAIFEPIVSQLYFEYCESFQDCINNMIVDHYNHVRFDNVRKNLRGTSVAQNNINKFRRGYTYYAKDRFFAKEYRLKDVVTKYNAEDEISYELGCLDYNTHLGCNNTYKGDFTYTFDFLECRLGSEDILDLERTGKITHEEACLRHVMKYADNAWVVLRFHLIDYFKEHNIPLPNYTLDAKGFMIDCDTHEQLSDSKLAFFEKADTVLSHIYDRSSLAYRFLRTEDTDRVEDEVLKEDTEILNECINKGYSLVSEDESEDDYFSDSYGDTEFIEDSNTTSEITLEESTAPDTELQEDLDNGSKVDTQETYFLDIDDNDEFPLF